MRRFQEISFRLRQEVANAFLYSFPPSPRTLPAISPLPLLPDPKGVAEAARRTRYASELTLLADKIVQGKLILFGNEVGYEREVAWRSDPVLNKKTSRKYFRLIPYLDAAVAGDHKRIWEPNRHQHWVLLAQAFVLTGCGKYLDTIFAQMKHWWSENPFQRGINWTSALEVGFRALSWIWVWHLVGNEMPRGLRQRFLVELYRHGLHLQYNLSIHFSPNTHLLGEAVALHALGRLFPDWPRADLWDRLGRSIVREHMQRRVRLDGSYFEQSTYYHVYALDFFLLHTVFEDASADYKDGLSRMADFLASIAMTSGSIPLLGDDDGGRVFHPYGDPARFSAGTLATASALLGKELFAYCDDDLAEVGFWWFGPERCRVAVASAPVRQSRSLVDSGIVVMKHGSIGALFDAGPFGPWGAGHSHADTLSLVVWVGDQQILIDPGTYTYVDSVWRDAFRGTAAHNTVSVDEHSQAIPAGPFRWVEKPEVRLVEFSTSPGLDAAVGECRYRGITHRRTVHFQDGYDFRILDEIDGPSGDHLLEQYWHTGSDPRRVSPGVWQIGDAATLLLEDGDATCESGWRSRSFGSKQRSPVIVVRRRTSLPARLNARLKLKIHR